MTWRIHFTTEDVLRMRIAPTLGPLAETLLGLRLLASPKRPPNGLGLWRDQARTRLHPRMKPLAALGPHGTLGLDLWTLAGETPTIETGVEALLAMRPEQVRAEVEMADSTMPMPRWAWRLADRDGEARRVLADSAMVSFQSCLTRSGPRCATICRPNAPPGDAA